jgi:riboflavin synthase
MFTGLVEDLGTIEELRTTDDGARVVIRTRLAAELGQGDSIAVNGCCLTAIDPTAETFAADAMNESLRRTALGALEQGSPVNLELALRADARLGGHIMQGHVDGVATLRDVREEGFSRVLTFAADPSLLRYVVEKGSIAVSGVSLTVSAVDDDSFAVSLIPETLERTTLGALAPGSPVNLEVDIVAKYVEKLVGR